ncbi:hypothetical protein [Spiroplasma endosymbiont of Othius punctulatus]|uniref:hypothetical protein n=1 Tax=Spiroplasma endosymbiont of Othius punctulatus TaxID=3066289 RepID=UPI0030CEF924
MKQKTIIYIVTVIATLFFIATVILGFKLINFKDSVQNSGEDSVVVLTTINESKPEDEPKIFEPTYNVAGLSLYSVISKNKEFKVESNGLITAIGDITNDEKHSWMIYSTTNPNCKSNTIVPNQCMLGANELYLSNVNEFTFRYQALK